MTNDLGDFPTAITSDWAAWLDDTALTDPLDDLAPWIPNEPAVFKTADAAAFARSINAPGPLPGSDVRAREITVSPDAVRKANEKLGCVFTVECDTGRHYTFRVSRAKKRDDRDPPLFAFVLTGTQNDDPWHYTYLGIVTENLRYAATKGSKIHDDREGIFNDALQAIKDGDLPDGIVAVENAGFCSMCGRFLTNPASLKTGIGPECTKKGEG